MTRLVRFVLLAVIVIAAAYALYVYLRPEPVTVIVREIDRGLVEATVANTRAGTVEACRRAKLSPRTGGQVARLPVREGDRVEAGALLLELWNDELKVQLQLSESTARAAAARAEQSCLAADLAAREADRTLRLFANGIVGDSVRDRAEADQQTTAANCRAARASVEEARSLVEVAREELDMTILRAPFEGIVAELNAELGEVVTPSPPGIPTPPAVDLIEEGCLYVVAPLDEVDAPRLLPGQPVRVSFDAFPAQAFDGTVRRIAPYVLDRERQARTVDVEVDLARPEEIPGLLPGYSADIEVLLEKRDDALRVPTEALVADGTVLVLVGGILEERRIESGLANWQYTEVLDGLEQGSLVVLSLDRDGVEVGAAAVAE